MKDIIALFLAICILLAGGTVIFGSIGYVLSHVTTVSPGSLRQGQIVKIANEGYIFKTNEVEIIKGGMNSGSGAFGQPFYFTISSPDLVKKAQEYFTNGTEIIVSYHAKAICPFSSQNEACNFADDIEPAIGKQHD